MEPLQPVPINTVSNLDYKEILDGIQVLGKSLNIVSIKYIGNTKLLIKELIYADSPTKYKGIAEVQGFTKVVSIKLANIGDVIVLLLLCTKKKLETRPRNSLFRIRNDIVKALRRAIERLPDTSITKRDSAFRLGEDFAINNQHDWEQVGENFSAELSEVYQHLDESNSLYGFWKDMKISQDIKDGQKFADGEKEGCFYFTAQTLGQENVMRMWFKMIDDEEMNDRFDFIRLENIIRLIVHWATDYTIPSDLSSQYLLVPNTQYISSKLGHHNLNYYCPFLSIPGFGNIRYTCKEQQMEDNIFGCQVYSRWTNYMKHQDKNYPFFRKLFIPDRLCALAENRFKFSIDNTQETFQKTRLDKDKKILKYEDIQLVRNALRILEAGVEVRVEVVHSSAISSGSKTTIGTKMEHSFDEVKDWLNHNGLAVWNQKEMFSYMEKKMVMDWANYFFLPAIKTLEQMTRKTNEILSANTIVDIPHSAFWSAEDYCDAKAAEIIICFFLSGRLFEGPAGFNPTEALRFYGLDVKNRRGDFSLKNVKLDNGHIRSVSLGAPFNVPKWISWPEVLFLHDIRSAMETAFTTNTLNGICLPRALLGYAISFEAEEKNKHANIKYNKYTGNDADDGLHFHTIIFESNLYHKHKKTKNCRKTVKALQDMVNDLKEASASGKPVVSYVLNLVESRLKNVNPSWNIGDPIIKYLEDKYFKYKVDVPIVFSQTGGHYLAGIPYGFCSYPMDEYSPLLKNTYLWYKGNSSSCKLKSAEEYYFNKFGSFFDIFSTNLRSKVRINELIRLLCLASEGKADGEEAGRIVAEIESCCVDEKWSLEHVKEFLKIPFHL